MEAERAQKSKRRRIIYSICVFINSFLLYNSIESILVDFKRIFVQVADDVHGDDNARKCDNN
jgi:hypothetical protein